MQAAHPALRAQVFGDHGSERRFIWRRRMGCGWRHGFYITRVSGGLVLFDLRCPELVPRERRPCPFEPTEQRAREPKRPGQHESAPNPDGEIEAPGGSKRAVRAIREPNQVRAVATSAAYVHVR